MHSCRDPLTLQAAWIPSSKLYSTHGIDREVTFPFTQPLPVQHVHQANQRDSSAYTVLWGRTQDISRHLYYCQQSDLLSFNGSDQASTMIVNTSPMAMRAYHPRASTSSATSATRAPASPTLCPVREGIYKMPIAESLTKVTT